MRVGPWIAAGIAALTLAWTASAPAQQEGRGPSVTPAPAAEAPATIAAPARIAPAPGAPAAYASTPTAAPGAHPLTAVDLEAWLEGFMPYALERGDIAGAVVVVVADGQTLLQKGYGYSDVDARKPVDPERTLFRPGSVSKLFTWSAVMQLVEQGKLDLDADVNTYLDFRIPPRDGKPITLRNIMTHTAGFEESIKDLIVETPSKVNLRTRMTQWIPHRIFAPGATPAYSNYATSLAGYIVERVSGEQFETYVERHIFQPLGMQHSTFRQPLPQALQADMAKGYSRGSADKPGFFEIVALPPAGALSSSGADMARFMLAHLGDGAFGSERILQAATSQRMHSEANTVIPPLNRMLLGFYETNINGRRAIAHAGDTNFFHTDLNLFPDDGVGLYISMNSTGREGAAGDVRSSLFEQFADRYLPGPSPDGQVEADLAKTHARLMAGVYENSRRSESSFLSLLFATGHFTVAATKEGSIIVPQLRGLNGAPTKWREIAPFVWREVDGHWRLAAVVENGRVVRFSIDQLPFMVFERTPGWKSSSLVVPALLVSFGILAITALFWPVIAIVRARYKTHFQLEGVAAIAHRSVRIAAVAVVVVFGAFAATITAMLSGEIGDMLTAKTDPLILALRIGSLVVFSAAAAIALWNAFVVWTGKRSWWAKVWSTLIALACLIVLAYALAFRLIGFDANY